VKTTFRIEALTRAVHVDSAGNTVETVNRFERPVFEVRLVCGGRIAHDYVTPGSSYRKTETGFELSRWGKLVAAALNTERPEARVDPGVLIGRAVDIETKEDERGRERVVTYGSVRK